MIKKLKEILPVVVCLGLIVGAFIICNNYTNDSIKSCMKHHSEEVCLKHA